MKKDATTEMKHRRNKGQFYTPTLFVDYAHKMISEALGDDWKEQYVVFDSACGTGNLTKDYRFKELYCSTLEDAELEIGKVNNPEAIKFQYDFLNDDLEKLPKGLLEAFEQNKHIVILMNPPYGSPGQWNAIKTNTVIKKEMNQSKMGHASANLYSQFLYRVLMIKEKYNLENLYLCVFCPPSFLTSLVFNNFRNKLLDNFYLDNAVLFKAGHFANVSSDWGISFSIWKTGESLDKNNFPYKLIDNIDGKIKIIGDKTLYNLDNANSLNSWLKRDTKSIKVDVAPELTSGIRIKVNDTSHQGKMIKGALGCLFIHSNNVDSNIQGVALFSSAFSSSHNVSIIPNNSDKIVTCFSARRLIEKTWINSNDEYLAPNESHPKFQEFVNDSIVYSLFDSKSDQSSLRQIQYHNKLWDIKNEFFWMSKFEIESLANEYNNDECYKDAHTSPERFVYQKLQEIELSPEAQAALDKASDIVRNTFKYRELFNEDHPEYQINNWDCGWYQIKALAKEYAKDDLEEFKKLYKALADKMRPIVYELGFLK